MGEFDVKVWDVNKGFQAYDDGIRTNSRLAQMARERETHEEEKKKRSALVEIGNQAAGGNMQGARDAAFRSGNLDVGMKFDEQRRNSETQELTSIAGAITSADTPEKFTAVLGSIEQRRKLAPGTLSGKYRFEHKEAILGEVIGAQKTTKPTDDIAEFEYARKQGFKGTLEEWMQRKRAGAGEYGLQPIYGVDKEGRPSVMQLGKSGTAVQSKVPDGFAIAKDPIKVDAGTHFVLLDPQTRQQIGMVPKNIEGKEAAEERGKAQGQAQVNLPNIIAKTGQSIKLIDDMLAHPGRETATGLSGQLDPRNYLRGTQAKDFQVRQKQLQGRTFLEAFESLKGGGAITEIEGQKAEAAIARLDLAQSDEAYAEALTELRDILRGGLDRARARAAQPPQQRPGTTPAPGAPPAPTSRLPQGVTPDAAIAEAKAAIAAGKDRNAIISRLQGWGLDTAGL